MMGDQRPRAIPLCLPSRVTVDPQADAELVEHLKSLGFEAVGSRDIMVKKDIKTMTIYRHPDHPLGTQALLAQQKQLEAVRLRGEKPIAFKEEEVFKLVFNPKFMESLNLPDDVAFSIVSAIGPTRSGKSTLLSQLLQSCGNDVVHFRKIPAGTPIAADEEGKHDTLGIMEGFKASDYGLTVTLGIWVWPELLLLKGKDENDQDKKYMLLLDIEGKASIDDANGKKSDPTYFDRLYAVTRGLSTVVLWNESTSSKLTGMGVNFKPFATESKVYAEKFDIVRQKPALIFCGRNWPSAVSPEADTKEWNNFRKTTPWTKDLDSAFASVTFVSFPLPMENAREAYATRVCDLEKVYQDKLKGMIQLIVDKAEDFQDGNGGVEGLLQLAETLVKKDYHALPETLLNRRRSDELKQAKTMALSALQTLRLPLPAKDLEAVIERSLLQSIQMYTKKLEEIFYSKEPAQEAPKQLRAEVEEGIAEIRQKNDRLIKEVCLQHRQMLKPFVQHAFADYYRGGSSEKQVKKSIQKVIEGKPMMNQNFTEYFERSEAVEDFYKLYQDFLAEQDQVESNAKDRAYGIFVEPFMTGTPETLDEIVPMFEKEIKGKTLKSLNKLNDRIDQECDSQIRKAMKAYKQSCEEKKIPSNRQCSNLSLLLEDLSEELRSLVVDAIIVIRQGHDLALVNVLLTPHFLSRDGVADVAAHQALARKGDDKLPLHWLKQKALAVLVEAIFQENQAPEWKYQHIDFKTLVDDNVSDTYLQFSMDFLTALMKTLPSAPMRVVCSWKTNDGDYPVSQPDLVDKLKLEGRDFVSVAERDEYSIVIAKSELESQRLLSLNKQDVKKRKLIATPVVYLALIAELKKAYKSGSSGHKRKEQLVRSCCYTLVHPDDERLSLLVFDYELNYWDARELGSHGKSLVLRPAVEVLVKEPPSWRDRKWWRHSAHLALATPQADGTCSLWFWDTEGAEAFKKQRAKAGDVLPTPLRPSPADKRRAKNLFMTPPVQLESVPYFEWNPETYHKMVDRLRAQASDPGEIEEYMRSHVNCPSRQEAEERLRRQLFDQARVVVMIHTEQTLFSAPDYLQLDQLTSKLYNALVPPPNSPQERQQQERDSRLSLPRMLPRKQSGTAVRVVHQDCLDAAQAAIRRGFTRVAVLNMANATQIGGGYERGRNAQEEDLVRRSTLLSALQMGHEKLEGYGETNDNHRGWEGLPDFSVLHSFPVVVFRSSGDQGYSYLNTPFPIGVLSAAAYNARDQRRGDSRYFNPDQGKFFLTTEGIMRTRKKVEAIIRAGATEKHDCLVLSAFGCGAFSNRPEEMAAIFRSVLSEFAGVFKEVVVAIIGSDENLRAFRSILTDDNEMLTYTATSGNGGNTWNLIGNSELPCSRGAVCTDCDQEQHISEFAHPPWCVDMVSCNDQSLMHRQLHIHPQRCVRWGLCPLVPANHALHFNRYQHPPACSLQGLCGTGEGAHLREFLHVPQCPDGVKCKNSTRKHRLEFRHMRAQCEDGASCTRWKVFVDDQEHWQHFGHPMRPPCQESVSACTLKDKDHVENFSHICPLGLQCADYLAVVGKSSCTAEQQLHYQTSFHLELIDCPRGGLCRELCDEDHVAMFHHPEQPSFRTLCKNGAGCTHRGNPVHVAQYSHPDLELRGVCTLAARRQSVEYLESFYSVPDQKNNNNNNNKNNQKQPQQQLTDELHRIPFFFNAQVFGERVDKYLQANVMGPQPSAHIPSFREIVRTFKRLKPVHRCKAHILKSVLNLNCLLSRHELKQLGNVGLPLVDLILSAPEVEAITSKAPSYLDSMGVVVDRIARVHKIERKKYDPSDNSGMRYDDDTLAELKRMMALDRIKLGEVLGRGSFERLVDATKRVVEAAEDLGTLAQQNSAAAVANPALAQGGQGGQLGIGYVVDKELKTDHTVFAVLGPNYGDSYGDIYLIFDPTILWHPDSYLVPHAATFYVSPKPERVAGPRPWAASVDKLSAEFGRNLFNSERLHPATTQWAVLMAKDFVARVVASKPGTPIEEITWQHIEEIYRKENSHYGIEAHLPSRVPLSYVRYIVITQQTFDDHFQDFKINRKLEGPEFVICKTAQEAQRRARELTISQDFSPPKGMGFMLAPEPIPKEAPVPLKAGDPTQPRLYFKARGTSFIVTLSDEQAGQFRSGFTAFVSSGLTYISNSLPVEHGNFQARPNLAKAFSTNFNRGLDTTSYIHYHFWVDLKNRKMGLEHWGPSAMRALSPPLIFTFEKDCVLPKEVLYPSVYCMKSTTTFFDMRMPPSPEAQGAFVRPTIAAIDPASRAHSAGPSYVSEHRRWLQRELTKHNLKESPVVRRDGNCFPDSVAVGLGLALGHAAGYASSQRVRNQIVDFLEEKGEKFVLPSFGQPLGLMVSPPRPWIAFLKSMRQDRQWMESPCISVVPLVFGRPLEILMSWDSWDIYKAPESSGKPPAPIRMAYWNQTHYCALIPA